MKHLEVRQKYSAARRIFNSLLSVSSGDETLRLVLDILQRNSSMCHKESFLFDCKMSIVNCRKMKIMLEKHIVDWGQSDAHFPRTEQYYYRCIYFEALDLIVNGIQSRLFNQGIKSIRILKTSFSRQFQETISQASHSSTCSFYDQIQTRNLLKRILLFWKCMLKNVP